jgi:hypothetical protein
LPFSSAVSLSIILWPVAWDRPIMDMDADTPDGRRYYETNGWTFWEYADATGAQQPMEALRKAGRGVNTPKKRPPLTAGTLNGPTLWRGSAICDASSRQSIRGRDSPGAGG